MVENEVEELCSTLLEFIIKHPPAGVSIPFIEINIMCGRLDRITEYIKGFNRED